MPITVQYSESKQIAVISLMEETMETTTGAELHRVTVDIIQSGINKMVLDMSKVKYLTAGGIGTLLQVHSQIQRYGSRIVLTNVNRSVYHLLVVTKLVTVFEISPNLATALAQLSA